MKKIFILVPFIALAACGQIKSETTSCVYDTQKNTKTCSLTSREVGEIKTNLSAASEGATLIAVTRVNGVGYNVMSDGTLVPNPTVRVPEGTAVGIK